MQIGKSMYVFSLYPFFIAILIIYFWLNILRTVGNLDGARKIYKKASQQNTDWPEYIFDAWGQFEHQYGTVDNLELAIMFIKKQMTIVTQRRERASSDICVTNSFTDRTFSHNILINYRLLWRKENYLMQCKLIEITNP